MIHHYFKRSQSYLKTFKREFLGIGIFAITLLAGCTSHLAKWQATPTHTNDYAMEELRSEIADLKHALHSQQVDLEILEERLRSQETSVATLRTSKQTKWEQLHQQVHSLEKKTYQIEKFQEAASTDLKELSQHAQQTVHMLSQHRDKLSECEKGIDLYTQKLDEVIKLKSTLTSLSNAMQTKPLEKIYEVKAGDSLAKIASSHGTSIASLKKHNKLNTDNIIPGQKLKIPHE